MDKTYIPDVPFNGLISNSRVKSALQKLIVALLEAMGPVKDGYLAADQFARADALIDERLISRQDATDQEKLAGCLIKTFLRMPHKSEAFAASLERFVRGQYKVTNKYETVVRDSSVALLAFNQQYSDGWSLNHVIADGLSNGPYKEMAEAVGKQMAFLLYMQEVKQFSDPIYPFVMLQKELNKTGITPFKHIHLLEFAGHPLSTMARPEAQLGALLGSYQLIPGCVSGGAAQKGRERFVSLDDPGGFAKLAQRPNAIITRNIFNGGAVDKKSISAQRNVGGLLSVMSNVLTDNGRLYVSSSAGDIEDLRVMNRLLAFTGFAHDSDFLPRSKSYILRRDYRIKDRKAITSDDFNRFISEKWTASATFPVVGTGIMGLGHG